MFRFKPPGAAGERMKVSYQECKIFYSVKPKLTRLQILRIVFTCSRYWLATWNMKLSSCVVNTTFHMGHRHLVMDKKRFLVTQEKKEE